MFGLLLILILMIWAVFYHPSIKETGDLPTKITNKLDQLWNIAQDSIRENKYLRAEKALLTILRVDEKNATAYNRLGILYAKQRAYKDAIECFEIAQSLEPSASSLHNVGLIYYETENYEKAALAFEQALEIEGDLVWYGFGLPNGTFHQLVKERIVRTTVKGDAAHLPIAVDGNGDLGQQRGVPVPPFRQLPVTSETCCHLCPILGLDGRHALLSAGGGLGSALKGPSIPAHRVLHAGQFLAGAFGIGLGLPRIRLGAPGIFGGLSPRLFLHTTIGLTLPLGYLFRQPAGSLFPNLPLFLPLPLALLQFFLA